MCCGRLSHPCNDKLHACTKMRKKNSLACTMSSLRRTMGLFSLTASSSYTPKSHVALRVLPPTYLIHPNRSQERSWPKRNIKYLSQNSNCSLITCTRNTPTLPPKEGSSSSLYSWPRDSTSHNKVASAMLMPTAK